MGKATSSLLGIDINSRAVKLLELACSNGQYQIKNYVITPLSADVVRGKTIIDKRAVIKALKLSLQQMRAQTKFAVVAMANTAVMTKLIQVDNSLNETEIENYIFFEADNYFETPLAQIYLDFMIIGPHPANEKQIDVMVIAAPRKEVELRAEIVKAAGLKLKAVDVESLALARIAKFCNEEAVLLVQAEHQSLLLVLSHNNHLLYVHAEHWQDDQTDLFIVQQVQRQLQIIGLQQAIYPQQILLMGDRAQLPLAKIFHEQTLIPTNLSQPAPALMLSYGLAMWQFA